MLRRAGFFAWLIAALFAAPIAHAVRAYVDDSCADAAVASLK
jgi:hypothetical protein